MIASYLRESTDKQDIETQRTRIQEHCARKNIPCQEFADDAVSGLVPFNKRPQSKKLLEAAKQGSLKAVIVYRFDRLGRDHADTYIAIGELLKRGVEVFSLMEGPAENTASGRLKTGILTLFSQHERDSIVERSVDASKRLAEEGIWLGGIVPYGYRKDGVDKQARLVVSMEPVPDCKFSEADVIRRIFTQAADGKSCVAIANDLTRVGVPPAYVRDVLRGKRKQSTAGIWRPSRIRNLIISKTYKGVHEWGKRIKARDEDGGKHLKASPPEQWITRPCPAIVDETLWQSANAALHKNQNLAMAHPKNDYLLRGLIRCGLCGLTYIGTAVTRPSGKKEFYYRCNGKHGARGLYGENGQRCPSPSVRGAELESAVWTDIEVFLAKPGAVLRQLEQQIAESGKGQKVSEEIAALEAARTHKAETRRRALDAYTEAWISKEEFGQKLRSIDAETANIEERLTELRKLNAEQDSNALALGAARTLLGELQNKTRGKMPFGQRRRSVEALVLGITVTPVDRQKQPNICIRYTFEPHHERYSKQWGSTASLALSNTGRNSSPSPA